jgi:competence protein ComEC
VAGGKEKSFDAGRDAIGPFLKQEGIQRIDGILISHPHNDHYGGLPWLVEHFTVDRLIDTGYLPEPAYENARKRFAANGGKFQTAVAGDRVDLDERLQVDVLAPPKGFFGETHRENRAKWDPPSHYLPNKNSMIVRIRHGEIVILLPGDIEEQDQREFLQGYFKPGDLQATIPLAPGHGIHSLPAFAEAVQPKVVVVSCLRRYGGGPKAKATILREQSRKERVSAEIAGSSRRDGTSGELKLAGRMRQLGSSQRALVSGGATGKRQPGPRSDTRSCQSRHLNPPGCGVADEKATRVARTRARKCRMS